MFPVTGNIILLGNMNVNGVPSGMSDSLSCAAHAAMKALLADLRSGAKDQMDTIEHTSLGQERIIYTALRDADGAYRGVVETVLPMERVDRPGAE